MIIGQKQQEYADKSIELCGDKPISPNNFIKYILKKGIMKKVIDNPFKGDIIVNAHTGEKIGIVSKNRNSTTTYKKYGMVIKYNWITGLTVRDNT